MVERHQVADRPRRERRRRRRPAAEGGRPSTSGSDEQHEQQPAPRRASAPPARSARRARAAAPTAARTERAREQRRDDKHAVERLAHQRRRRRPRASGRPRRSRRRSRPTPAPATARPRRPISTTVSGPDAPRMRRSQEPLPPSLSPARARPPAAGARRSARLERPRKPWPSARCWATWWKVIASPCDQVVRLVAPRRHPDRQRGERDQGEPRLEASGGARPSVCGGAGATRGSRPPRSRRRPGNPRFPLLDAMRAVAALSIVVTHASGVCGLQRPPTARRLHRAAELRRRRSSSSLGLPALPAVRRRPAAGPPRDRHARLRPPPHPAHRAGLLGRAHRAGDLAGPAGFWDGAVVGRSTLHADLLADRVAQGIVARVDAVHRDAASTSCCRSTRRPRRGCCAGGRGARRASSTPCWPSWPPRHGAAPRLPRRHGGTSRTRCWGLRLVLLGMGLAVTSVPLHAVPVRTPAAHRSSAAVAAVGGGGRLLVVVSQIGMPALPARVHAQRLVLGHVGTGCCAASSPCRSCSATGPAAGPAAAHLAPGGVARPRLLRDLPLAPPAAGRVQRPRRAGLASPRSLLPAARRGDRHAARRQLLPRRAPPAALQGPAAPPRGTGGGGCERTQRGAPRVAQHAER